MNNEIIIKIKSLFPDLTKSEKKVALFVNEHMNQILYLSISDLANQCDVGETTILRFCKRLGFSGYYEFKQQAILQIQKSESNEKLMSHSTLKSIDTMMKETVQLLDDKKLEIAAKMIINSQTIYLFGSGFSGLTASAAQVRLTSLGYKAVVAKDKYLKILCANTMNENDLAIGFSISGENHSTIESMKLVKGNKAKIISLTNHEESSLAKLSDLILLTSGKEMGREGSTLVTEMSQFIVLEMLFEKLHQIDKERIENINYKVSCYIRGE